MERQLRLLTSPLAERISSLEYTSSDCYKYSIVDEEGVVFEPDDIFYTPEAAEREGREAINTVSN